MSAKRRPTPGPADSDVDSALTSLDADELRAVLRELLLELDPRALSRSKTALVHRAARRGSGWEPATPREDEVAQALAFAQAAEHVGRADPSAVDEHLRRGSMAFFRQDYSAAHRILGALLLPIGEGDIDLGQDELVDEVLGADLGECAAQYVVSAYMLAPPMERADAVDAAIADVRRIGHFWEPLRVMERAAVEELPGLRAFLPQWRALVARKLARRPADARRNAWDDEEARWLREVVQRLDGSAGLAVIARSSGRADDLRAWCRSLVDAGDWKLALAAYEESAELVADADRARDEFLDGAALAAQELGRDDLPQRLERAWRAGPTLLRLRRWLGSAGSRAVLSEHAASALAACPERAARQRALLHVLRDDFQSAAKLLASARGLAWSSDEHPGPLLFPLFAGLLGGTRQPLPRSTASLAQRRVDFEELDVDELGSLADDRDGPRLATPQVEQILKTAGIHRISNAAARSDVLDALRKSVENRLAGVTRDKRRREYGQAAELVAVCHACDPSPESARWVASIGTAHRRFPALRAELDRALGLS